MLQVKRDKTSLMAKKTNPLPLNVQPQAVPSAHSRRQELLEYLLSHNTNPTHARILRAYMASHTVDGAEQEFEKIIQEIVDEA